MRYRRCSNRRTTNDVRTTLNIDDDVLIAIKEIAARSLTSAGAVASSLIRQGLTAHAADAAVGGSDGQFGFHPFPSRGEIVTNELINRLREETGD